MELGAYLEEPTQTHDEKHLRVTNYLLSEMNRDGPANKMKQKKLATNHKNWTEQHHDIADDKTSNEYPFLHKYKIIFRKVFSWHLRQRKILMIA